MLLKLLLAMHAWAQKLRDRLVATADPDTLTPVTSERHQVRIQSAEVEVPWTWQLYGARAQEAPGGREARMTAQDAD